MIRQICEVLESTGYPYYRQGSMNESQAYPDSFFTFYNPATDDDKAFDNTPTYCVWTYWVYFYSTDPVKVETELLKVKARLQELGWYVNGKGNDVGSDEPTHTGRMIEASFIENY